MGLNLKMFLVYRLEFLQNTEKLFWMEYWIIWQHPNQQISGSIETDLTRADSDHFGQSEIFCKKKVDLNFIH